VVAYARRFINVDFSGPSGSVHVEGHRVSAAIVTAGQLDMGQAEVAIYGLPVKTMNQLATFGTRFRPQFTTTMTVTAGDNVNGMHQVFTGTLSQAWGDFQSAPDVPFHAIAFQGSLEAVKTQTPSTAFSSYTGPTQATQILQTLAGSAGLTFENNGVKAILDSPYLFGSILNQIKAVAQAGGFNYVIENNTLAIWPQGKARDAASGGNGLLISKETGMVSSPTFTDFGLIVKTEFSRPIDYGASFTIKSMLTPANRTWYTVRKEYDLQSLVPKGHWFLSLWGCSDPGLAQTFLTQG
jgi:hypothetical protein